MALSTDLPIYKVAYDLFLFSVKASKNMPRDYKATMGGDMRRECAAVALQVYRANSSEDKRPHLRALLEGLEVVNLLMRASMDLRLISKPQYAQAIKLTGDVGKQANGWLKHSSSGPAGRPSRQSVPSPY